mmetsp:Transcript_15291/g.42284  ORF Transcript_15291/g.42284 Transcript_15291/m.42284 type:complete len:233 (+) Transcript_15291:1064-1762(+)
MWPSTIHPRSSLPLSPSACTCHRLTLRIPNVHTLLLGVVVAIVEILLNDLTEHAQDDDRHDHVDQFATRPRCETCDDNRSPHQRLRQRPAHTGPSTDTSQHRHGRPRQRFCHRHDGTTEAGFARFIFRPMARAEQSTKDCIVDVFSFATFWLTSACGGNTSAIVVAVFLLPFVFFPSVVVVGIGMQAQHFVERFFHAIFPKSLGFLRLLRTIACSAAATTAATVGWCLRLWL